MARILDQLVGHHDTLTPLLDAAAAGRLAPTLLFSGSSGIGKRLAAMALAQALVCEKSVREACGECGSCLRVEKRQSESVFEYAPEGAHIKIEQARDILQRLALRNLGRSRVVIIDQAHLMNPQAANALLKSLEEPPQGTYFILVTPLASGVLPTIRSRSQLVRFRPLGEGELRKVLGPEVDDWVIRSAHGSVDTARRMQENREGFQAVEEAVRAFVASAPHRLPVDEINRLKEIMKDRSVQEYAVTLLQGYLRDSLRSQAGVAPAVSPLSDMLDATSGLMPEVLRDLADLSIELEHDLSRNVDRGLVLESFAIQWRSAAQISEQARGQR